MYNGEMVKRLERDALGKSFFHPLQSPVSELVQHVHAWPSQGVVVLDGLYLSIPEFKASLRHFVPYAQRTYLMLHYLESMNTYYAAPGQAALWTDEKRWLSAVQGIIVPSRQGTCGSISHVRASTRRRVPSALPGIARVPADRLRQPEILSANDPITLMTVGTLSRRQRPARCGVHARPAADDDECSAPSDWELRHRTPVTPQRFARSSRSRTCKRASLSMAVCRNRRSLSCYPRAICISPPRAMRVTLWLPLKPWRTDYR